MTKKTLLLTCAAGACLSLLCAAACTQTQSSAPKEAEYTLEETSENITAAFGSGYTAPQYKIFKDGADTGYKAKMNAALSPSGETVVISYSSFTLGELGDYKLTYVSNGLMEAEDLQAELTFEVTVTSADTVGPTVSVVSESEFCVWTGKEIKVPAFEAADASGIEEGSLKIFVELPDGVRTQIEEKTYTPMSAGEYKWIFSARDKLGNDAEKAVPFTVVESPEEIAGCIAYFNQAFGVNQIEAYNAEKSFDADFVWEDGSKGATVLTQDVSQSAIEGTQGAGKGIDYVSAIELAAPYLTEVTGNFDYMIVPIHNPNAYPITVRAWWFSVVEVQAGATVWYAVPSEHFKQGNQAMTSGDYQTIYDVTNMVFACSDRYNSWGTPEGEMLAAGTKWYIGNLIAGNYDYVDGNEKITIAEFDTRAAGSYIGSFTDNMLSWREDADLISEELGIGGALVFTGDSRLALESCCAFTIRYTAYGKEELAKLMGDLDYLRFYVKFTARNKMASAKTEIGWGTIPVQLTNEWQEVRIYAKNLDDLYLIDDTMTIRLIGDGSEGRNYDGLEVAFSKIELIAGLRGFYEREEDVLVYTDLKGAEQLSSENSSVTVDTSVKYQDEESSLKVTLNGEGGGDNTISVTIEKSAIGGVVTKYDYIVVPVFNGDPDADGEMYVDFNGEWYKYTTIKGQTWAEISIPTAEFEAICKNADLPGVTMRVYSYYTGTVSLNIGKIRGETVELGEVVQDELVYFDREVGKRQVSVSGAVMSYDTAHKFGEEAGSTRLVSTVDCVFASECTFSVRFDAPYITDLSAYDYLILPVFNANAYDMICKTYWSDWVTLKHGEWTKIAFSAAKVAGGFYKNRADDGDAPWNGGEFFIGFADSSGTWDEEKVAEMKKGCTVYLGAMRGYAYAENDGFSLLSCGGDAAIVDQTAEGAFEAFKAGTTKGVYAHRGTAKATAEGIEITSPANGYCNIAFNPTETNFKLADYDAVAIALSNPSEVDLVVTTLWYGDIYLKAGTSATMLLPVKKILSAEDSEIKDFTDGAKLGENLNGLALRVVDSNWENSVPEGTVILVESVKLVTFGGGIFSF